MNSKVLHQKITLTEVTHGVASGKIDCVELFEEHLAKIKSLNPVLNALIHVDEEAARTSLKEQAIEAKNGRFRGRLHGAVYCAKDSVAVANQPQSDGSANSVKTAPAHSTLIEKLTREGAVCIGKSNMAERGKSYYTENPIYGRTNNPFDHGRSPGGSGGGDAAAVASNFSQFGIGADAGGSVRVPASFCGLFGLFPTRGVLSDTSPGRFTHTIANLFRNIGPLAKSLDDLELLFSVLKGYDPLDPVSLEFPARVNSEAESRNVSFVYFDSLNGVRCDSQISESLENAKDLFERAGFKATQGAPMPCNAAYEIYIVLAAQAQLTLEDILATQDGSALELEKEGLTLKNLRSRIEKELPPLTVNTLLKFWYTVDFLRNEIAKFFMQHGFIIAPTAATLPPLHDTSKYEINGRTLQSQQVFQFASMVNLLGLPAISFPAGVSKEGLPIGLQIIGPRFSEKRLFTFLRRAGFTERVCFPS